MEWRDAVVAALHRYSQEHQTKVVTRQALIAEQLPQIVRDTASKGVSPDQTLSRILQELQDERLLHFTSRGAYLLLDATVDAEQDDLPDDAIDVALEANKLKLGDVETAESESAARVRRGQGRIRALTLKYYEYRCGLCDVADRSLLVAGHISRWADDPESRGNLSNVICMCSFHDVLFENGYISFADDYRVLRRPGIESRTIQRLLETTERLRSDVPHPASPVFLRRHRIRTGFEG